MKKIEESMKKQSDKKAYSFPEPALGVKKGSIVIEPMDILTADEYHRLPSYKRLAILQEYSDQTYARIVGGLPIQRLQFSFEDELKGSKYVSFIFKVEQYDLFDKDFDSVKLKHEVLTTTDPQLQKLREEQEKYYTLEESVQGSKFSEMYRPWQIWSKGKVMYRLCTASLDETAAMYKLKKITGPSKILSLEEGDLKDQGDKTIGRVTIRSDLSKSKTASVPFIDHKYLFKPGGK